MMPNMSGDQMVAELRKHPELTDVPIVMLTARADDELRVNMLRLGVQEYLNKPFSDDELLARIGRLLADRKRSIEQLRASEAKILRLNAELEQRVEERTTELLAANRELDAFAYAVSHDLRAPLRAMSGFSQALIEDYGDRLEGEARVFLDQIIIGSRRMGELIDGLLTLSRSTRGELRRDKVHLSAMAERLLNELSTQEPGRKVQWTVMPALSVTGDEAMLEVVLRNLLSNAWKYTSNRDQADIRFYARQEGSQQLFFVADNGAGFETAHAAKLFQPFQRLHRQEEFPGIGIGLATAQRIIHRHGGMIRAQGQQDRGATFSFSIPKEH
jgi:light-regulated signal transduction histidine kinase (bacteriophytochrome)